MRNISTFAVIDLDSSSSTTTWTSSRHASLYRLIESEALAASTKGISFPCCHGTHAFQRCQLFRPRLTSLKSPSAVWIFIDLRLACILVYFQDVHGFTKLTSGPCMCVSSVYSISGLSGLSSVLPLVCSVSLGLASL